MNKTFFTLAVLVSAVPNLAMANERGIAFGRSDFLSAKPMERGGEIFANIKLSKSGKAKLRRLGIDEKDLTRIKKS